MSPVERLNAFLTNMLQWEVQLYRNRRASIRKEIEYSTFLVIEESAKKELNNIFSEHLSSKALSTIAKSRLDLLATGSPPEFDQDILKDTFCVVGKTAYVETIIKSALVPRRRYAFTLDKEGEYKIDAVFGAIRGHDRKGNINPVKVLKQLAV